MFYIYIYIYIKSYRYKFVYNFSLFHLIIELKLRSLLNNEKEKHFSKPNSGCFGFIVNPSYRIMLSACIKI